MGIAAMSKATRSEPTGSDQLGGLFSDFAQIGSTILSVLKWAVKGNQVTSEQLSNLIDAGFTTLTDTVQNIRRRLLEIQSECREGEPQRVVQHLKDLGSFQKWEEQEREMRMCRPFREFRDLLHGVFSGGIDEKKRGALLKIVDDMILSGEDRMADYISSRLQHISSLHLELEREELSLSEVRARLGKYMSDLNVLRSDLMRQEQQARDLLARY